MFFDQVEIIGIATIIRRLSPCSFELKMKCFITSSPYLNMLNWLAKEWSIFSTGNMNIGMISLRLQMYRFSCQTIRRSDRNASILRFITGPRYDIPWVFFL